MAKEVHGASKKRKKRRWTKEEKRNRIQQTDGTFRASKKSKRQQFNARVLQLAGKCFSNGKGVEILKNYVPQKDQAESAIRTVSSRLLQLLKRDDFNLPSLPAPITITVKPLLICDINGVLCHRVRTDPYPNLPYRESAKKVSGTPVIPRPGLDDFLEFLAHHFCLAIWTSAKPKSAQLLVKAIIPDHIQSKLIFVWAQNQCDVQSYNVNSVDQKIDERSAVFVKSLHKVYSRFPLWNSTNTLLIDDSEEKIPTRDAANVLHPPPMNGRQSSDNLSQYGIMSDLENHEHQMTFFTSLVDKLDSIGMDDQFAGKFVFLSLLNDPSYEEHMKRNHKMKPMESLQHNCA